MSHQVSSQQCSQPYGMTTHDHQNMKATACVRLNDLKIDHNVDEFSVIGVDEAQFFPDALPFTQEMANLGKTVIVASLDGSYQRTAFGNILNLVPLAEDVIKSTAACNKRYDLLRGGKLLKMNRVKRQSCK